MRWTTCLVTAGTSTRVVATPADALGVDQAAATARATASDRIGLTTPNGSVRAVMAIEVHQTKRAVVYRVIVPSAGPGSPTVTKTFRSRAAAQAWERDMLQAKERPARP